MTEARPSWWFDEPDTQWAGDERSDDPREERLVEVYERDRQRPEDAPE